MKLKVLLCAVQEVKVEERIASNSEVVTQEGARSMDPGNQEPKRSFHTGSKVPLSSASMARWRTKTNCLTSSLACMSGKINVSTTFRLDS